MTSTRDSTPTAGMTIKHSSIRFHRNNNNNSNGAATTTTTTTTKRCDVSKSSRNRLPIKATTRSRRKRPIRVRSSAKFQRNDDDNSVVILSHRPLIEEATAASSLAEEQNARMKKRLLELCDMRFAELVAMEQASITTTTTTNTTPEEVAKETKQQQQQQNPCVVARSFSSMPRCVSNTTTDDDDDNKSVLSSSSSSSSCDGSTTTCCLWDGFPSTLQDSTDSSRLDWKGGDESDDDEKIDERSDERFNPLEAAPDHRLHFPGNGNWGNWCGCEYCGPVINRIPMDEEDK